MTLPLAHRSTARSRHKLAPAVRVSTQKRDRHNPLHGDTGLLATAPVRRHEIAPPIRW